MPSPGSTFFLGALVLLGAGYLFFFESDMESTDERQRLAARVLRVTAEEIERVKLRRDAWTSAVVERVGPTEFRVTEPNVAAADAAQVARVLSALEFMDSRADLDGAGIEAKRLVEYGLDPPRLEVDLRLAKGQEQRLILGAEAPLNGGVYVRANGEDALRVVDKAVFELLDAELSRLTGTENRVDESEGG
jgi:hypothetical protein